MSYEEIAAILYFPLYENWSNTIEAGKESGVIWKGYVCTFQNYFNKLVTKNKQFL